MVRKTGKMIVLAWLVVTAVGALVYLMSRVGLGKLPGDIAIHAGNTRIYLPIATSVVLSAWLMLIVGLLRHRRRGSSCRKQGDEAAEDPESTNENDE